MNLKKSMGEYQFDIWYMNIQQLLQQDGIYYHGHVDHVTLNKAYCHAGFLLYPTAFQETGCITVLRAMLYGSIPITSRLIPSVLYDLTIDYDLGPKYYPLNISIVDNNESIQNWLEHHWTPSVIRAYDMNQEILNKHRLRMRDYVLSKYTWKISAQTMSKFLA